MPAYEKTLHKAWALVPVPIIVWAVGSLLFPSAKGFPSIVVSLPLTYAFFLIWTRRDFREIHEWMRMREGRQPQPLNRETNQKA